MYKIQQNKLLRSINIYSLPISLRYRNSKKYSTFSGIILSIFTYIIVILITSMYILDLFTHNGFIIMTNYSPNFQKTTIDFSKIPFMIGFVNWERTYQKLNKSYLNIIFDRNVHNIYKNEKGYYNIERKSYSINLEKCNPKIHYINQNNFMYNFDYNKFLCPVPGQNLSFGGRFGDHINGYDILEIHLNKCMNSSDYDSVICESEEKITNFLNNSYLEFIYISEIPQHNDYKNPIVKYVRNEIYTIAKENTKRYYQYFTLSEYISDDGLFFKRKTKFPFIETERTDLDFVKEEDQEYYSRNALLEVSLTFTDKKKIYTRTYLKIQDVMRNIGGFIDLIYIICKFICTYLSSKRMLLDIINHILFEDKYEKNINRKTSSLYNLNISSNIRRNDDLFKSKTLTRSPIINNFMEFKPTKTSLIVINTKNHFESPKTFFKIKIWDYFVPMIALEKIKKYNWLFFYKKLFSQYMSIEIIIPIIERLTKLNFESKKSNYFRIN